MWDLSCTDWEDRLRNGRSLVPELPLIASEARLGLAFFDELRLPDVPGTPKLGDASGQWFREIVQAAFGSWDPKSQIQHIRDIFAMAPKGSSKTSYSAGLMLAKMLMNNRPRAEALFVGPTQAISDRAYEQAVGMIDESPELKRRFRPRDHIKTIEDLVNKSEMKVKTFDLNILTGSILIFVLLDELHLLGRNIHTTKLLRQIRGGLEKTPEGQLLITTTQSDDVPIGAFKDELKMARNIRDGKFRGQLIRSMLPVLYELPAAIAKDPEQWQDPANWPMVMPNLGKSVQLASLHADWLTEKEKGEHAVKVWASQHLNIEIGVGINADGWIGAELWPKAHAEGLTLDEILDRSDVVVAGIDGGGLDDLFGLALIGRDRKTREWLGWAHAWAQDIVLERRKDIAQQLLDFEEGGDLTICRGEGAARQDFRECADILVKVSDRGLFPKENAVGLDPLGVAALVDELASRGFTGDQMKAIGQGFRLSPAVWGIERKLRDGTFWHCGQPMMAWALANAKTEQRGNAVIITKQLAGKAKIDPLVALFNATELMSYNPEGAAGMNDYFAALAGTAG